MPPGFQGVLDLAIGDLDGDGMADVGVAEQVSTLQGRVWLLHGNGAGGFVAAPASLAQTLVPRYVMFADTNGDERLDILATSVPNSLLLRNDGMGGFSSAPLPTFTIAVGIDDFTGDRVPDLFVRNLNGVGLAVGDGAGGFGPVQVVPGLDGQAVNACVPGDVDCDGDRDVVIGYGAPIPVHLLRNDGTGTFTAEPVPLAGSVSFPIDVRLADFDGDGLPDLVARGGFGGFAVHRNLGRQFAFQPLFVQNGPQDLAVGDVDGDGVVDLVIVDASGIKLLRGTGGGTFVLAESQAVANNGRLELADVDGNGGLDVIAIGGPSLFVLRNQQPTPAGVAAYGTGTASCRGRIGIRALASPTIGTQAFAVSCSNTPAYATGLLAVGTRVTGGWDPFGLDLVLHLGFAVPAAVMHSDCGGAARGTLPLPAHPFLVGLKVNLQSFWLADAGAGDTCSPAFADLVSSRGLTLTLQP